MTYILTIVVLLLTANLASAVASARHIGEILVSRSAGASHLARTQNDRSLKGSAYSPPPYLTAEEVRIPAEDVSLAGTLFLPKANQAAKIPALVMIAPLHSTRDGLSVSSGFHYSYRQLAEHFASRGVAVLRFDRRCSGGSGCAPSNSLVTSSEDGLAAVKFLAERKEIDPKKIWVLGHGDGAVVAANVGSHESVAGLIALAGIGRNGLKFLRDWERQKTADNKMTEAAREAYLKDFEFLISRLMNGERSGDKAAPTFRDELTDPLIKGQQYAYGWLIDDPLLIYSHTIGPALIIHGGKDRRIPVREGVYIKETFDVEGRKDAFLHVIPDMDYFLKENKGVPSLAVDNDINRPLDAALLKVLDEWVEKRIK